MLKSLSKPMQMLVVCALALIAFLALQPMLFPAEPTKVTKNILPSKPKAKADDIYTLEDKKAHFGTVSLNVKDTFKPEIIKLGIGGGRLSQVNLVPPEFAGGEANWSYTGSATIDGVLQALLENKTTGEDVFLKVGDSWKGISVEEITDDSLLLASTETGTEKKLELPPDPTTAPAGGPGALAPARPPLQGNIGPMSLQPDGSAVQPDTSAAPMTDFSNGNGGGFGGGRGRGRGRNRGGGRGGG